MMVVAGGAAAILFAIVIAFDGVVDAGAAAAGVDTAGAAACLLFMTMLASDSDCGLIGGGGMTAGTDGPGLTDGALAG